MPSTSPCTRPRRWPRRRSRLLPALARGPRGRPAWLRGTTSPGSWAGCGHRRSEVRRASCRVVSPTGRAQLASGCGNVPGGIAVTNANETSPLRPQPPPSPIDPSALLPVLDPLGRARTLPGVAYASEEVLAWEGAHFFEDSWVCVGRE